MTQLDKMNLNELIESYEKLCKEGCEDEANNLWVYIKYNYPDYIAYEEDIEAQSMKDAGAAETAFEDYIDNKYKTR